MRRYVFRLTFLACAVLGTSVVLGNDQQIKQTVFEKLTAEKQSGGLKNFNIGCEVKDGDVLWLSGRVASEEQKSRALNIAARVPGVRQVVDDLTVMPEAKRPAIARRQAPAKSMMTAFSSSVRQAVTGGETQHAEQAAAQEIGTGVSAPAPLPAAPTPPAPLPVPQAQQPYYGPAAMPANQPIPYVYAGPRSQVPLAVAPARTIAYQGGPVGAEGAPAPIQVPGTSVGMAQARYDHPSMPGYAWPSYAASPNYAAVTYPKQYSPTAWPYIGPFYPYPQVPLGWRKVTLEWDDGWWMLDFKNRRH